MSRYLLSRLTLTCLLLVLAFLPFPSRADADLDMRQQMAKRIARAWQAEDFRTLEAMENQFLDPAQRTPSGKRLLAVFEKYLGSFITIRPTADVLDGILHGTPTLGAEWRNGPDPKVYQNRELEWKKVEERIGRWERAYPDSPHPKIARAIYFNNKGQYFRGGNWASQVPAEAWPIYLDNAARARKVLMETQAVSKRNPMWFSEMFSTLGAQPLPADAVESLVADTLKSGQGYQTALDVAFIYLQPRWGGSYKKMERFARQAQRLTEPQEGGEVYARLYWNLVTGQPDEMDRDFFARTGASWPLLKDSFERMVRQHPEPRNLSGYALFTCMANDPTGARSLLRRAGTQDYVAGWTTELKEACLPR